MLLRRLATLELSFTELILDAWGLGVLGSLPALRSLTVRCESVDAEREPP